MTGVMPLPPQSPRTGRSLSCGQNTPAGLVSLHRVARTEVVEEPVGDKPARHALDGDGQVAVGLRGARHGVRAQLLVSVDVHPEGAELPGTVPEGLAQLVGNVEDERACVVCLANDAA